MVEIVRVGDVVAELGECPVWSASEQKLYWEDIEGQRIHCTDPVSGDTVSREVPGRPGSFVFTKTPGRLLVALETNLVWLDWETGAVEHFVSVEEETSVNRLNDGRCDHAGRYIVGTMHPVPAEMQSTGSLYSISPDGRVDVLETDVGIPNNTVFDPDRNRMYWADTPHGKIWQWDYDLQTGQRSNKTLFYDYKAASAVSGLPDGACLDAEGFLWLSLIHISEPTRPY